jgi:hypothetical protein
MVLSRAAHSLVALALMMATTVSLHAQTTLDQLPPLPADVPAPSLPADSVDTVPNDDNLAQQILVSPREPRCADSEQVGGITVCGKKKDNSKDRLPITSELNSATATGDGLPRAPDVMGNRITGHSIHFGAAPPGLLPDINFRMLPPAPAGSDADRIAKGEIRAD